MNQDDLYQSRLKALIDEIGRFVNDIDSNVVRATTIESLAKCLMDFAQKQYDFFQIGFDVNDEAIILNMKTL